MKKNKKISDKIINVGYILLILEFILMIIELILGHNDKATLFGILAILLFANVAARTVVSWIFLILDYLILTTHEINNIKDEINNVKESLEKDNKKRKNGKVNTTK